jgi:dTDP-4-amino-4,6-dideoxygalactose transaminase
MLRAAGIGTGDEVIVPAFGNVELAEAVTLVGAVPIFADIDPVTYCLAPDAVASEINSRTAAVIVVHRFGRPADEQLRTVGLRHDLLVLEQTEHGEDTLDGPFGAGQRKAHAALLNRRLTGVLTPDGCAEHTYQQYVVRVPGNGRPDRDAFARSLRARGVDCVVPVKTPVHRLPAFRRSVCLPETERACDETLALPVAAKLNDRDMQRVISACNALGGLLQPA